MLVEFRVTNYRSIRDTQVFSMVASKDNSLQELNCLKTDIDAIPTLVRSAVLYGANASGKSNLIAALDSMVTIIRHSATRTEGENWKLYVAPFADVDNSNKPTEFEVTFIEDGVRYQYGFALTIHRITQEWLIVYKTHKPQVWFEREYNTKEGKDEWSLGPHLKGEKKLWADSTRSNALFLSTAVQLNSEQLRPIYNWFKDQVVIFEGQPDDPFETIDCITESAGKEQVMKILESADLGITDIQVENLLINEEDPIPDSLKKFASTRGEDLSKYFRKAKVTVFHRGAFTLALKEESLGTKILFAYAKPIIDALENGKIIVVDELDSSLHPKMVRFLLSLINTSSNKNNAQLFFSTHNTSLLDTDLLRRDQIWFVEKDPEAQASHLYPLTDFSPRKGEALEKGYLQGRYGAIPFFGEVNL